MIYDTTKYHIWLLNTPFIDKKSNKHTSDPLIESVVKDLRLEKSSTPMILNDIWHY